MVDNPLHTVVFADLMISDVIAIVLFLVIWAIIGAWASRQTKGSIIGLVVLIVGGILFIAFLVRLIWGTSFYEEVTSWGDSISLACLFVMSSQINSGVDQKGKWFRGSRITKIQRFKIPGLVADKKGSTGTGIAIAAAAIFIVLIIVVGVIPYFNPAGAHDWLVEENDYLGSVGVLVAILFGVVALFGAIWAIMKTRGK